MLKWFQKPDLKGKTSSRTRFEQQLPQTVADAWMPRLQRGLTHAYANSPMQSKSGSRSGGFVRASEVSARAGSAFSSGCNTRMRSRCLDSSILNELACRRPQRSTARLRA